jgi:hypothetical protein
MVDSDDAIGQVHIVRPNDVRQYLFKILYADAKDPDLLVP